MLRTNTSRTDRGQLHPDHPADVVHDLVLTRLPELLKIVEELTR